MLIPEGEYRYEIRRGGEIVAYEEERLERGHLTGVRRSRDGTNRHEVEADLDADGLVRRIVVRYARGPFTRSATYEAAEDFLRGNVGAVAGRQAVTAKLGRFREVDGGLVLFRALILAHIRARRQRHWTGRVAMIDPSSLVAVSQKHSARQRDPAGRIWVYEPGMGDSEEIEIDTDGRIVRGREARRLSGGELAARHLAVAVEGRALVEHQARRADGALDARGCEQFHLLARGDLAA
jgi:hypothetical protein